MRDTHGNGNACCRRFQFDCRMAGGSARRGPLAQPGLALPAALRAHRRKERRPCSAAPTDLSEAAGFSFTWKAPRAKSATSMDTCWPRKFKMPFKLSNCMTRMIRTSDGAFSAKRRMRCFGRRSTLNIKIIERHRGRSEGPRHSSRPGRRGCLERLPGTCGLLCPLV